jgi:hypothetical protein
LLCFCGASLDENHKVLNGENATGEGRAGDFSLCALQRKLLLLLAEEVNDVF